MNNDKLDDLLQVGAAFDWITPTWAILKDMANGPVARFGIMANVGFDRGDIRRLLSKNGVESWGYIYNLGGDLIMLSVREHQARWANYVLQREGVPVLYSPVEAVEPKVSPTEPEGLAKPSVALSNSFHAGEMSLVKAPNVWGLLGGLLKRLMG